MFGLIGFLDATYLTFQHYNQGILPCYIFSGCDKVLTSSYATVAGIPISLAGSLYYLTILVTVFLFWDVGSKKAFQVLIYLPIAAFAISLGLLSIQLFIIHEICLYCIISLASSSVLFVFSLLLKKAR